MRRRGPRPGTVASLFFNVEGRPLGVITLDIADDQVQAVRAISNPDKLRHLGTFAGRLGPES